MNLILLPGNSPENKDWIDELRKLFQPDFETVWVQYWQHWQTPLESENDNNLKQYLSLYPEHKRTFLTGQTDEPVIDLEKELARLIKNIDLSKDYAIFAKSAGVALALKGVFENKIKPTACVFAGAPIFWARANDFAIDKWLKDFSLPTLFIQQTQGPAISSKELAEVLKNLNVKNYQLIEVEGDSHHCPDTKQLHSFTVEFLRRPSPSEVKSS